MSQIKIRDDRDRACLPVGRDYADWEISQIEREIGKCWIVY